MKKCPFCAEQIQDEAIKCRYCGEMLNGATPTPFSRPAPRAAAPVDPTTFSGALRSSFQQYSSATGRASRAEYWWYALFVVLSVGMAGLLSQEFAGLVLLVLIVPSICAVIRRLHDVGQSGASLFWVFVPLLGNLYLLFLLASRGNPNPNAYGEPPVGPASADTSPATWNPPKITSETLWMVGGLAALIGLLAWLPGFMRQAANLDDEMHDTIISVGAAELRYLLEHGSYTSDWEALSQDSALRVPGGLWVTLYASADAFCAQVENLKGPEGGRQFASTKTEYVEQRSDGSIWVAHVWGPCGSKIIDRIRLGSGSGAEPNPAIIDFDPPGALKLENFVGRWVLDDPVRFRWLEVLSDGRFTYVENPGSPGEVVIRGTAEIDFALERLALYKTGSNPLRDLPATWGHLVQLADPTIQFGILIDRGLSCPLLDPTCLDLLQRSPGAEMPRLNADVSQPVQGAATGAGSTGTVTSLHPAGAFSEEMYLGLWASVGPLGAVDLDMREDHTFTYTTSSISFDGEWSMNMDVGLAILWPEEGEPASVALVVLDAREFGLLFTVDDCGSFDVSCGDIFTTA